MIPFFPGLLRMAAGGFLIFLGGCLSLPLLRTCRTLHLQSQSLGGIQVNQAYFVKYESVLLGNYWLDDDATKDNDEAKLGVIKSLGQLFKVKEGRGKKSFKLGSYQSRVGL